jgi:sensor histidine kinase YesM
MMLYTVILAVMVGIIIGICYLSNNRFSREYNRMSDLYRELSMFYTQMRESRSNVQNYFYLMTSDDLNRYYSSVQAAAGSLDTVMELVDDGDLWFRFRILNNMMESCSECFEKIRGNRNIRLGNTGNYQYLIYLFELTDGTQREYYSYLVNYTKSRQIILRNAWRRLNLIISVIIASVFLSALIFSINSSRWVTYPINCIVRNIRKIKKGEYDLSAVKDSGPEFAVLGEAFDDMANSIRATIRDIETNARLRQQLLEAENENLRMNELLIGSELKTLQDQMNPHFLFNTLGMISRIAAMEHANQAAELMDITTSLLRYSLDKSNRMATLYEELECVRNYLHIQRLRFGNAINFELKVDDDLPNVMLPGMLLQPLIENAVIHGVSGDSRRERDGAVVAVSANRKSGLLCLAVEDNGKGMSGEKLEELLNAASYPEEDSGARIHIGLLNAKKRVEMLFGNSATFHVESTEDVGTLISISIAYDEIPKIAGGGTYVHGYGR